MDVSGAVRPVDIDEDPTITKRTFWEDDTFFAAISRGYIRPGHTLICPHPVVFRERRRPRSLHDSMMSPGAIDALTSAVKSVITCLRARYGDSYAVFEHGNVCSRSTPTVCGTEYPHLHVLPLDECIVDNVVDRHRYGAGRELRRYSTLEHFYSSRRGSGQYLLASDEWNASGGETIAIWSGYECPLPSQAIRHTVQELLGDSPTRWQEQDKDESTVREACDMARDLRRDRTSGNGEKRRQGSSVVA